MYKHVGRIQNRISTPFSKLSKVSRQNLGYFCSKQMKKYQVELFAPSNLCVRCDCSSNWITPRLLNDLLHYLSFIENTIKLIYYFCQSKMKNKNHNASILIKRIIFVVWIIPFINKNHIQAFILTINLNQFVRSNWRSSLCSPLLFA